MPATPEDLSGNSDQREAEQVGEQVGEQEIVLADEQIVISTVPQGHESDEENDADVVVVSTMPEDSDDDFIVLSTKPEKEETR
jgi:hypothetical protein